MDKIKVGLPRGLFYYYYYDIWKTFLQELNIEVVESIPTNKDIMSRGINLANDEMCLSFKIYLGHIDYLKDKCDYILVPRIDNYGLQSQTCTNFLAAYDIVNNLIDKKILNYNINYRKFEQELDGLFKIGKELHKKRRDIIRAYKTATKRYEKRKNKDIKDNYDNLDKAGLKILLVSHPYNTYDDYIGKPIIDYLKQLGVIVIYSDKFDNEETEELAYTLSDTIYFKYSKENIGAIPLTYKKIDGIIFLSSFPCGLDSLVNELVMRKINKPYLNLVVDDSDSLTGIKTRLESFVDILEQKRN